ncbi:MAG: GIY-YIG nuclease family protein [Baekduia sp.]
MPVKIGKSDRPDRRLASLQTSHWLKLKLLAVAWSEDDAALEARLHATFHRDRLEGEWFSRSPQLEEVIADAAGKWPLPGSFADLCRVDPRLERLVNDARVEAERAPRMSTVCREDAFERRFRPRLERLVGWGRRGAGPRGLATRAAYDVAEAGLRDLLPPCRGCLCP